MSVTAPVRPNVPPASPLSRWSSRAPDRLPAAQLAMTTLASIAALICLVLLGQLSGHLLLIPPMAASMALVAAAPQSPLSQPRSVIGGQFVAAILGVGTGLVSHSIWAAAIAGGLTIGATLCLRMPHSPAAATAVIGTMATTGQVSFVVCSAIAAGILVSFGILRSRLRGGEYPTYWL
jgi:CBS-domain-containing membrane protein